MMKNTALSIVNSMPKKKWKEPVIELIAIDEIASGNTSGGAEGVPTPFRPGFTYHS